MKVRGVHCLISSKSVFDGFAVQEDKLRCHKSVFMCAYCFSRGVIFFFFFGVMGNETASVS